MLNFLAKKETPEAEVRAPIKSLCSIQLKEGEIWQIDMGGSQFLYCFTEGDELIVDFCKFKSNHRDSKLVLQAGEEIKINDQFLYRKYRANFKTGETVELKYIGNGKLEIKYPGLPNIDLPKDAKTVVILGGGEEPKKRDPYARERHILPVEKIRYELAQLPKASPWSTIKESRDKMSNKVFLRPLKGIKFESIDWDAGYTGDEDSWPPMFDIKKIKGSNPDELKKVIETLTDEAGSENAIGMAVYRHISNTPENMASETPGDKEKSRKAKARKFIRETYWHLF